MKHLSYSPIYAIAHATCIAYLADILSPEIGVSVIYISLVGGSKQAFWPICKCADKQQDRPYEHN